MNKPTPHALAREEIMGKANIMADAMAAYYNPFGGRNQAERDAMHQDAQEAGDALRAEIDAQLEAAFERGRASMRAPA